MSTATLRARPAFLRGIVSVVLAHFLAVLVMAASPHAHDLAHDDAGDADHFNNGFFTQAFSLAEPGIDRNLTVPIRADPATCSGAMADENP